jgi:hypothetical protein
MKKAAFQHTSSSSGESAFGFGLLDPFVTAAVPIWERFPKWIRSREFFDAGS